LKKYVETYLRLIADGDTTELARFLLIDGGVTDRYVDIARRVIEYHMPYDIRRASVQSVEYYETETEKHYSVLVRDGRGEMFRVEAGYGDALVGIDVSSFSG
jgi:hypothetical protein